MATLEKRPFSKDYSGLINQSVVAGAILLITFTAHDLMRRKRRGKRRGGEGLGSVESWEFGYLYQGRSWAKRPSPGLPKWPLAWVKQAIEFPEDRINQLRGVDAALYLRFLRGCMFFALLHSFTTLPILFPIHVTFSDSSVSKKSMTRASISSLVTTEKGKSLLWVHIVLLFYVTLSWMGTLYWICRGAFKFRAYHILQAANRAASNEAEQRRGQYDPHPHPHPQYPFHALPPLDDEHSNRGLRLRTVMVTNIPPALRSDKDLKEYFEYYLSRPVARPAIGITASTQPGFLNKTFAFMFNQARRIPEQVVAGRSSPTETVPSGPQEPKTPTFEAPALDRVVLVRRMNELASLLERREEILKLLETAHIKLARKALASVKEAIEERRDGSMLRNAVRRMSMAATKTLGQSGSVEGEGSEENGEPEGEDRMELLIRTLSPFLDEAEPGLVSESPSGWKSWWTKNRTYTESSPLTRRRREASDGSAPPKTVWDALLSLPRSTLDAYQPLIHLSSLFRGKTVPTIDYYTAKLQIITNIITEKRGMSASDYIPMSTAFVSFVDPAGARRACKYLAVHPENPLLCNVTMAPSYEDLDWTRLMKPTFGAEFVKDWVVDVGVWAFTLLWLFPVSLFVGLVNIQNLSSLWPGLAAFLDKHAWEEELLQSFAPTVLTALLTLLIPLLLLLIAKRAHTIATLSALHDRIMTRYYKFLIVNLLVFFCVGTFAVQSVLLSFKASSALNVIEIIAQSFPIAAPFYVGWFIFTTAMHSGIELALIGLPLIMYPSTRAQVTPRKRAMGIRPRTLNYYYWLPNHMLVIHVLVVFALLNPLVIPFAAIYFMVDSTVLKNQLIHVYAKNYEGNGQLLLIRMIRYSLDGSIFGQVVFLAYMVVNKKSINVGLAAVLIIFTAVVKLLMTRMCRNRFERDDILEAKIVCGTGDATEDLIDAGQPNFQEEVERQLESPPAPSNSWPFNFQLKFNFVHGTIRTRARKAGQRQPNPFAPPRRSDSVVPLNPSSSSETGAPMPSVSADPLLEVCREASREDQVAEEEPSNATVYRHPPHRPWDDESSPNHTYDNPYFTRDLDNVLWLPRDPCGVLDLDDTVNMRMSLTTQIGAGRLGAWREEFIESGISFPFATSFSSLAESEAMSLQPSYRPLDGTEQIDLPPAIASRIEVEKVDTAPSIRPHSRRRSTSRSYGTAKSHSQLGVGRPSNFRLSSSTGMRTTSFGSVGSSQGPPPSMLSAIDRRRSNRSTSMDHELGVRTVSRFRDSQMSRSMHSVLNSASASPGTPPHPPSQARLVTLQEAVYSTVLVEEEAAQDVVREADEDEEAKIQEPKSWLTRWMFARPE